MKRYLPAIPQKPFERLENKIAAWEQMRRYGYRPVVWKGFRKVGKMVILDNDGKSIHIAGADPYQ